LQIFLLNFIFVVTFSKGCAMCLWRWFKFDVFYILTMMTAFPHVAKFFHVYKSINFD